MNLLLGLIIKMVTFDQFLHLTIAWPFLWLLRRNFIIATCSANVKFGTYYNITKPKQIKLQFQLLCLYLNMKEIISIAVGQCGIRMASDFFDMAQKEHYMQQDGSVTQYRHDNKLSYFEEYKTDHYAPRAILVDSELGQINEVQSKSLGKLIKMQNCIYSAGSTSNNFAKGYYSLAHEISPNVLDCVRRATQQCDNLDAFQIYHSIGGGTGSGFSCHLMTSLIDSYSSRLRCNFIVMPSISLSDIVVEPYNALLAIPHIKQKGDFSIMINNQRLYDSAKSKGMVKVNYKSINQKISDMISDCTVMSRFNDEQRYSLRKYIINMSPFPWSHFLDFDLGGYSCQKNIETLKSFYELTNIKKDKNYNRGMKQNFIGMMSILRSDQPSMEYPTVINKYINKKFDSSGRYYPGLSFAKVSWLNGVIVNQTKMTRKNQKNQSVSLLYNHSRINEVFRQIKQKASVLYQRRAFLYHYQKEGLEIAQFQNALSETQDLISLYEQFNYVDSGCYQEHDDDSYCEEE